MCVIGEEGEYASPLTPPSLIVVPRTGMMRKGMMRPARAQRMGPRAPAVECRVNTAGGGRGLEPC